MTFKQQLAKYVTGNLTTDQLSDIGVTGIQEGLDTPSLRILAGLGKNEYPSQIEQYFRQSLKELKIELPDKRQAGVELALAIVDEILEGEKDIIEGTREIINDAIDSYDFFSESKHYSYDNIGFHTAYGLYVTYDELSTAYIQWEEGKTNEQLLKEVKKQLLKELVKWRNEFKTDA